MFDKLSRNVVIYLQILWQRKIVTTLFIKSFKGPIHLFQLVIHFNNVLYISKCEINVLNVYKIYKQGISK